MKTFLSITFQNALNWKNSWYYFLNIILVGLQREQTTGGVKLESLEPDPLERSSYTEESKPDHFKVLYTDIYYWFLFSALNVCSVSNTWIIESKRSSFLEVLVQDMTEKSTCYFIHFELDCNGFADFLFKVGTKNPPKKTVAVNISI